MLVSPAYWALNLVRYGCQLSVRSGLSSGIWALFKPLVRGGGGGGGGSESVRSRLLRLSMWLSIVWSLGHVSFLVVNWIGVC